MPIYAYRCEACGHAKDVLQKISDPLLTTCPACGAESFRKQVTAAGFQLKGSGWYVTDFRGGSGGAGATAAGGAAAASSGGEGSGPAAGGTSSADAAGSGAGSAASSSSSEGTSGGGGCGTSCACH